MIPERISQEQFALGVWHEIVDHWQHAYNTSSYMSEQEDAREHLVASMAQLEIRKATLEALQT